MDVLELTQALVAIPSVTNDEGPVARFLAERWTASGWHVSTQEVPPEGGKIPAEPRANVLALSEPGARPRVVLTTHIDTVPPFIPPTEDETHLYGRGVCDAKGILAAMWIAAERLRAEGVKGLALLAIAGEETDSIGAKIAHELLPSADWIVDGEPTDLMPSSGAKGILAFTLRAKGQAAHSAYPERGHAATHDLIAVLARLLTAELPGLPEYGDTTLNVGVMSGGVAPNVLAPSASAHVLIRLAAGSDVVLARVNELVGEGVEMEITSRAEPHRIHVPGGRDGVVVRFGSDVPYLAKIGRPLLVGPGSIHVAHTANERIAKKELYDAVELYVAIVRELMKESLS